MCENKLTVLLLRYPFLQPGPETDRSALTSLMAKLQEGEEAGVVLTNYTKSGRKFRNRLRVAPLRNKQTQEITHFIGVLKEITSEYNASETITNSV